MSASKQVLAHPTISSPKWTLGWPDLLFFHQLPMPLLLLWCNFANWETFQDLFNMLAIFLKIQKKLHAVLVTSPKYSFLTSTLTALTWSRHSSYSGCSEILEFLNTTGNAGKLPSHVPTCQWQGGFLRSQVNNPKQNGSPCQAGPILNSPAKLPGTLASVQDLPKILEVFFIC